MPMKQIQSHFRGLMSKSNCRAPWRVLQGLWRSFQKSSEPPTPQPDMKQVNNRVSPDSQAINYNGISALVEGGYMHVTPQRLVVVNPDPESEPADSIRSLRPFLSSTMRSSSYTHSLTSTRSTRPESRLSSVDTRATSILSESQESSLSFDLDHEEVDLFYHIIFNGLRVQISRNRVPQALGFLPDRSD
ncbi:uncharacterized protein BO72DRAFT_43261 [Aspergillus fijiensis CBS 313.89]|uniref:Uncharacterized protein n=1 Tax=Aspergillus fijiensis CBS 313.89 TaxID=1448319 RepID=A0A8G1RZ13_9EURO|nr:uncharacterized protein BO72DRAFT_43261 [Aspergillus fijiensis CBS 313.89]RAK79401.1 hypothetical protein BO72DRAFT_43261 [Aspergillus fijiensis CBS 313.89]